MQRKTLLVFSNLSLHKTVGQAKVLLTLLRSQVNWVQCLGARAKTEAKNANFGVFLDVGATCGSGSSGRGGR